MRSTKTFVLITLVLIMFVGVGCVDSTDTSDKKAAKQTEEIMRESARQCGMPNIVNHQEKKMAKLIIEQCDRADLICYAYKENLHGQFIFLGKCVGYGLPYSVQYTNPKKKVYGTNGGSIAIPQADPAGLFKPEGLPATWLNLINPADNKPYTVYMEPEITVSPFPIPGAITLEQLNEQVRNGN